MFVVRAVKAKADLEVFAPRLLGGKYYMTYIKNLKCFNCVNNFIAMSKEEVRISSDLRCVLCKRADETEITGALSFKGDTAAHQNCLLYASGIYCKNSPTYDDLFGFDVKDVKNETRRGRKLRCHFCNEKGATAGCEVKSCRRCYHYPCAHRARARSQEDGTTFRLYCVKHDPHGSSVGLEKDGTENSAKDVIEEGSENDSETPRRFQNKKRRYRQSFSDSDKSLDLEMAPIECEFEDTTPPEKISRQKLTSDPKSQDSQKHRVGGDFTAGDELCKDSDFESQSLFPAEYRQENVPFTVITDSGPSSGSENSLDPMSSAPPSPADTLVKVKQSVGTSSDLQVNIIVPPKPHVPVCTSLDSPPSGAAGESCDDDEALCKDVVVKIERCASRDQPPLQMAFQNELLGPTLPGGCSMAHTQSGVDHVAVLDSSAAIFWRRCNEVGCTGAIFTELTHQLSDLAERVKSLRATQQDYDVSLRILQASGRLPAIFHQIEKDVEHEEKQLQRKKEAVNDAKAVLLENQFI